MKNKATREHGFPPITEMYNGGEKGQLPLKMDHLPFLSTRALSPENNV